MAHIAEWRVRETTTTEGTTDLVLAGAMQGSLPFQNAAVMAVGDTCDYVVHYGTVFEAGLGTMAADGKLTRTTVYRALHANGDINTTKVSLPPGVKTVIMSSAPLFQSGTRLVFQQTSAPLGWTKDTTHNDKALRIVSGAASSGGTLAFSNVFGKTATDGHTLTIANLPAHSHGGATGGITAQHTHNTNNPFESFELPPGIGSGRFMWKNSTQPQQSSVEGNGHTHSIPSEGDGTAHVHGMDIRVQYVDVIIAQKN